MITNLYPAHLLIPTIPSAMMLLKYNLHP